MLVVNVQAKGLADETRSYRYAPSAGVVKRYSHWEDLPRYVQQLEDRGEYAAVERLHSALWATDDENPDVS